MAHEKTYIYGRHAVTEALSHTPDAVESIFLAPTMDDNKLLSLINNSGKLVTMLDVAKLPNGFESHNGSTPVHQGIIALITLGKIVRPYKEFVDSLEKGPDGKVLAKNSLIILGELQDPQNVGAVIRSAAAFGIAGVLIPEHNQAPVTGTVVKVSAGMAFRIPLISIGNINNAVRDLKEQGFWIYGLDGEATQSIATEKFDTPTVFILGNESKGIREKTRENCDILLSIPSHPQCESLNAAASAAVAMYAWSSQHPEALK